MCKIKIAHITTVDMSLRYLLLNQLSFLKQMGYDVFSISAPGDNTSAIEATGIHHISVPMSRKTFSPVADLLTIYQLYHVFRRENFTIVHTHFHKSGIYGRFAAKLAKVPIIIHTNHGLIFHEKSSFIWHFLFAKLEKIAGKSTDLILSVNNEDIKTILEERICPPSKVKSLGKGGIGINLSKFNPLRFSLEAITLRKSEIGIPNHVKVVGFVGRLVKEKGLIELFEAAQLIRRRIPEICFLIVGPTDNDKSDVVTPDLASQYGISDIIIFTGLCQNMPEIYALMTLLVLPSHREGFPMVLAEAAAMGKPVIATDIRGCRESVENGRNGLLVPFGDIQALADAIIDLLTDEEKAQRMGMEGRKVAYERFDECLVLKKMKLEYARLLREKGLSVPDISQND